MAISISSISASNTSQKELLRRHATETVLSMNEAVDPGKLTHLSGLSNEEVVHLQAEIGQLVPVGNVLGLILSGLTRLKGRVVTREHAKRDVLAMMRALDVLPQALYGVVVTSPATILFAYQKMLTLTGKDVESAFPDGLWQFYLEFAMREDAARHANETTGFFDSLTAYKLNLPLPDQLTAWVTVIMQLYFHYDEILLTEWHESTYLTLIEQQTEAAGLANDPLFRNLRGKWHRQKPYRRGADAQPTETYTQYRRRKFEQFCQAPYNRLPTTYRQELINIYQRRFENEAPAFQDQMSILATLDPDRYRENRRFIPLWQARVAIIWQQQYHLIPACAITDQGEPLCFDLHKDDQSPLPMSVSSKGQLIHPQHGPVYTDRKGMIITEDDNMPVGKLQLLPLNQVRHWVWAILSGQYQPNSQAARFDIELLQVPRGEQVRRRKKLSKEEQHHLEILKMASVIINWDERPANQNLSRIRRGRRGVGDQALTIFRTDKSFVFDQSHIFFDGIWGSVLVEIITNEATSWAAYLATLPSPGLPGTVPASEDTQKFLYREEVSAESAQADLKMMSDFRRSLSQREPDMAFTINDLLVLYRTLFNQEYEPSPALKKQVEALRKQDKRLAEAIYEWWAELSEDNPVLLIPIDATSVAPRDRLYPVTFRNPFPKLLDLFNDTHKAWLDYQQTNNTAAWSEFSALRQKLIAEILAFGKLMAAHKELTLTGDNPSMVSLRLLGHLHPSLQRMLDQIPERFDVLNEVLKGEEVFSNIGRVAKNTSVRRFMSACDDNSSKRLVWGFITDDDGVLHITVRDFSPLTQTLLEHNQPELARNISTDFLDSFVKGLNRFVRRLTQISDAMRPVRHKQKRA